jgi:hypothetical protein
VSFDAQVSRLDAAVLAAFSTPTTYQRSGGSPVPIAGIFDAAYVRVEVGEAGVQSVGPAVFYRLQDLPADPETETVNPVITINGVQYEPTEVQKDGVGGVRLLLHKH